MLLLTEKTHGKILVNGGKLMGLVSVKGGGGASYSMRVHGMILPLRGFEMTYWNLPKQQ